MSEVNEPVVIRSMAEFERAFGPSAFGSRQDERCKVRRFGPVITMRWTPRLGNAYCERRTHLWARRWTFALADDWAKPWTWGVL